MTIAGRITGEQFRNLDLLGNIFLARGFVFLQSATALSNFLTDAALAIKIASIFSRSTNSKFCYRQIF
jgi:hypothetical protein